MKSSQSQVTLIDLLVPQWRLIEPVLRWNCGKLCQSCRQLFEYCHHLSSPGLSLLWSWSTFQQSETGCPVRLITFQWCYTCILVNNTVTEFLQIEPDVLLKSLVKRPRSVMVLISSTSLLQQYWNCSKYFTLAWLRSCVKILPTNVWFIINTNALIWLTLMQQCI